MYSTNEVKPQNELEDHEFVLGHIPLSNIGQYKKKIANGRRVACEQKLRVAISADVHCNNFVSDLFVSTGDEIFMEVRSPLVRNDEGTENDFDLSSAKNYRKLFHLARKEKADLMISIGSKLREVGIAVRHQKRYKYIDGNQLAALYLNYLLESQTLRKQKPVEGILTSHIAGDFISEVARKHRLTVVETGTILGADKLISKDEKTVFEFDGIRGMGLKTDHKNGFDALMTSIDVTNMVRFYKDKKSNLYLELKKLYADYGRNRVSRFNKELSIEKSAKLISKIKKLKTVAGKRVEKVSQYGEGSDKITKVYFSDYSFVAMQHNGKTLDIFVQSWIKDYSNRNNIVFFEKDIMEWINDNSDEFLDKHFSTKAFFKYLIFISIIVGIMVFVFLKIYDTSTVAQSKKDIYSISSSLVNKSSRSLWLIVWVSIIAWQFLHGWKLKRMLSKMGESVKLRHLVISALMGSVISFVTPFAVGGDAIGYWYLRRKGFKRGPLLAAFISDTMLYQVKFTLQTIILISFGLPIYKELFNSNSPQSFAALVWFIVGVSWTIFSTIMIFSLTLSSRFQNFIIRTSIKLLEWTRFVNFNDPEGKAAVYYYDLGKMREGTKLIWQDWKFAIEVLLYSLLPLFLNPTTLILMVDGTIRNNVAGVNGYLATIVIDDIVGTANSMSITPGGSGTGEWLSIVSKKLIYTNTVYGSTTVASGIDFAYKLLFSWPMLAISALTIPTVIIWENNKIRKTNKIKLRKIKLNLYGLWAIIIVTLITYFYLIL